MMSIQEWVAVGVGIFFGCFVGWLILPWVYSWRRRKHVEIEIENTEGPDTYVWQDARSDALGDGQREMRVGRKLGRTLYLRGDGPPEDYEHDRVIGIVDTRWLAEEICRRWNAGRDG